MGDSFARLDDRKRFQLPYLSRFLDTNGDGTGTKNANGNFATPTQFFIAPASGQCFSIARLLIQIVDAGPLDAGSYGNGITLTNGVKIETRTGPSTTTLDLLNSMPVMTNGNWGRFSFDVLLTAFGTGDNYVSVRWTFARAETLITLNGDLNERLTVILEDDFSGLVGHFFLAQGLIAKG